MPKISVKGFAPEKARAPLTELSYNMSAPKAREVIIEISHCGICYSDIHLIDNDWGISNYPFVPGHEIVGTVRELGSRVKNFKIGQRVGLGWFSKICKTCTYCKSDRDNMCPSSEATCVGRNGGFADFVKADSEMVYQIPKEIKSEHAAPLMCGGWTVHGAFRGYKVKKGSRVAVLGIGGLGHLGLQFGKAMGFKMTAITSTKNKVKEAKSFGASNVITIDEINKYEKAFDFLLVTAHADLDWSQLLNTLDVDGNICFVGIPPSTVNVHVFSLLMKRLSISANPGGSRKMMREMLRIAARHKIKPKIETFTFDKVNEAIKKVKSNKIRYRAVLTY